MGKSNSKDVVVLSDDIQHPFQPIELQHMVRLVFGVMILCLYFSAPLKFLIIALT